MHDLLIQCNCLIFFYPASRGPSIFLDLSRKIEGLIFVNFDKAVAKLKALLLKQYHCTCLFHLTKQLNKLYLICSILKLWIYENPICDLRSEELFEGTSSQLYTQLMQLRKESMKKIQARMGLEPLNSTTCSQWACLLNWYIHNFIIIIKLRI